ncbi:MAG: cohesin domain-containing protein [Patescibacteria group bacterium]
MNPYLHSTKIGISIIALLLLVASSVEAATLSISPEQGTYVVGALIPVDVIVTSETRSVNAVSGTFSFSNKILEPVSIDTDTSIVDLWVSKPAVALNAKTIFFEGLMFNPGFQGTGKVATIYFRVLAEGNADIEFSSGLILANDGKGTNILDSFSGARLSLRGGEGNVGEELPERRASGSFVEDAALQIRPPVITQYSRTVAQVGDLFLQGVTYPTAQVQVYLQKEKESPSQYAIESDAAGNFVFMYGRDSGVGYTLPEMTVGSVLFPFISKRYYFWASVLNEGETSDATQVFEVIVGGLQGLGSSPVTFIIGGLLVLIGIAVLIALILMSMRNRRVLEALKIRPQSGQQTTQ